MCLLSLWFWLVSDVANQLNLQILLVAKLLYNCFALDGFVEKCFLDGSFRYELAMFVFSYEFKYEFEYLKTLNITTTAISDARHQKLE